MLSLYTTENIISLILKDNENKYDAWYDLIKETRPKLKVLLAEDTDFDDNEFNPVNILQKDYDLIIDLEYFDCVGTSSYIERVKSLSVERIEDPFAFFLLDIDEKDAEKISKKYEVICHSFETIPNTSPIFQEGIEKNINKEEKNRGWHELIPPDVIKPANTLVFIDRYLFSQDKADKKNNITLEDGIKNVCEILKFSLPETCGIDFHVLFVFDGTTLKSNDEFSDISTKINKFKKQLDRPYNILIELISISKNYFDYRDDSDSYYRPTHNRRILSNYYFIRAEHSLKAFRGSYSLYTQSLFFDWIASKGILSQKRSDVPAKSLYFTIREIKKAILKLKKIEKDQEDKENRRELLFSKNGNSKVKIQDISNRFIINPD